jgi:hypothetical protein
MDDGTNMELTIAGLTGVIKKMLTNPANELFDVDAYIDDEFGSDDEMMFGSNAKSIDHHTITTVQTDETTDASGGSLTPSSDIEECRCRQSSTESLDPKTDPFAPRVGKTLVWRDVNMTLVSALH